MRHIAKVQSKINAIKGDNQAITTTTEVTILLFIGVLVAIALYMLAKYVVGNGTNVGEKIANAFMDEPM